MEAGILTFGGILASLKTPDKTGHFDDVVLGYDDLPSYVQDKAHFGGIIGRYANRIANGRFTLDGKTYLLARNNGPNHLHGGIKGFDKVLWTARPVEMPDGPSVRLDYLSWDGEEGYPGNLSVTAIYTVTNENALRLDFRATTDQATVCNLTQHSYFNFHGSGEVMDYLVQINAGRYTPVNASLIPTGELQSVAGTPFDFRQPTAIGARIHGDHEQLKFAHGYDQNWVLDKAPGELGRVATVWDQTSGRRLEVLTTQPGMQFYTANFLDGVVGKGGHTHHQRHAFCMEPEHFPDSPNHPNFPSAELRMGQVYQNTIIYKFSAE